MRHGLLIAALTLGCSSGEEPGPPTDSDRDHDGIVDARDRCPDDAEDVDGFQDADGCPDPGSHLGPLPAEPTQTGVVYVGHYYTNDLRIFRTDGTEPYQEKSFDLGRVTHDMALDPYNDLLAIASDVDESMTLYSLHRPSGPSEGIQDPSQLVRLNHDHATLFVRFHPLRERLYVVTSTPESPPDPIAEYWLFAYDISTPASPVELSGSPFTIPVTAALDVDFARDLLFLIDYTTKDLYGYDLSTDELTPLPGEPVSLAALYPQTNTWAFNPINLTVDPWRNRLYAGRHQGALSELIALSYPEAVPISGTSYAAHGGMSDLTVVGDAFDVDVEPDSRPNLLGAYVPAIDVETGDVFLSADAWDEVTASALVVAMNVDDLSLATGCDAFEGFGCWLRSYFGGSPGFHQPTDGAACVDATHGVVVGTTYERTDESQAGGVRFFTYDSNLTMTPWLDSGDNTLNAGGLPVAAVCH